MNYIEMAVSLEKENAAFYLEQAENNKNSQLCDVFKLLAADEETHYSLLKKHAESIPYELEDKVDFTVYKNIFKKIKNSGEDDFIANPSQLDVYRKALVNEEKSLEFYQDFLAKCDKDTEKKLFNYLISQENSHIKIIDSLILHLNNAEEWVESAEFGLRDEY